MQVRRRSSRNGGQDGRGICAGDGQGIRVSIDWCGLDAREVLKFVLYEVVVVAVDTFVFILGDDCLVIVGLGV